MPLLWLHTLKACVLEGGLRDPLSHQELSQVAGGAPPLWGGEPPQPLRAGNQVQGLRALILSHGRPWGHAHPLSPSSVSTAPTSDENAQPWQVSPDSGTDGRTALPPSGGGSLSPSRKRQPPILPSSSTQAELKAPEGPGSTISTVPSQNPATSAQESHGAQCQPAPSLLALPQPRGKPVPDHGFPLTDHPLHALILSTKCACTKPCLS